MQSPVGRPSWQLGPRGAAAPERHQVILARGKKKKPKALVELVPDTVEEIAARAARLAERVLDEYAHIAFADLRHIVEWGPEGLFIKSLKELSDDDVAAISEIVPGVGAGQSRVKLYDKKAALDAIARHLGMFPLPTRQHEEKAPVDQEEDPREFLARELARLAAGATEE
jgi:hypothetical protein